MSDPVTPGILATLLGLLALMANREIREHRGRRNGNGTHPPLTCALAKERYDVLEKKLTSVAEGVGRLDDLAKGSFVPSHTALAKAGEAQDKYLREIRDASRATSAGVAELVEYQRKG